MGDKQSKPGSTPPGVEGSGDVAAGTAAEAPSQSDAPKNEAPSGVFGDGLTAEGETEPNMPSESEILAKLVTHLSHCEDRRMPLADIRAKLPASLQKMTEDPEAIRNWLSRFGGLIEIVGEPGQEQVVLDLGGGCKPAANGAAAPAGAAKSGAAVNAGQPSQIVPAAAPAIPTTLATTGGGYENGGAFHTGTDLADDESLSACTVQLRGLPFRAQVNDIKAFLGIHVHHLSTKDPAIRLLLNRDGRPSGFARVQFQTPEAARACREALHKQQMGDRYVEVLACSDRAGKARHRRAIATEHAAETYETAGAELVLDSATEAVERERVLQECRDHMRTPGRQQLLLSMLGIALSPAARTYLRRLNLGLKHFLARFPHEFRVEGPKGCEQVYWCPNGMPPAGMGGYADACMGPDQMMEQVAAMTAAWNAAAAHEVNHQMPPSTTNPLLASPTPQRTPHSHLLDTPSDWGTPGPAQPSTLQGGAAGAAGADAAHAAAAASQLDPSNPFAGGNPYAFGWPGAWGPGGGWPGAWPGQDMGDFDKGGHGGRAAKQRGGSKADPPAARSHAHLHPQAHPFAHKPPAVGSSAPPTAVHAPNGTEAEHMHSNVAAVRLRGLPFSMSVQDVLAFFAQHDVADRIADGPQAAQLLPKANGRPSGQARVQMRTRYDAEVAQQALHNQWIGGRYIEVFVYGEETEQQANDFNAQLGFPAGNPMETKEAAGGNGAHGQLPGGFPGFPPLGFPGGFPGGFPPAAAPPIWANMVMPQGPVPISGMPTGDNPALGQSLDTLFSFLYKDSQETEGAEGSGEGRTDQSQRNAVQV